MEDRAIYQVNKPELRHETVSLDEAKNRINLLRHFDYSLRLFESNYQELICEQKHQWSNSDEQIRA